MIRIASRSSFFGDSIEEVYSIRILRIRRNLVISRWRAVGNSQQGGMTFRSQESMQTRSCFTAKMLAEADIVITEEGSILQNPTIIKLVLSTAHNACGHEGISGLAGNAID